MDQTIVHNMTLRGFFAVLTADSLRWTAATADERRIETVIAYDELPSAVGVSFETFRDCVAVTAHVLHGVPIKGRAGKVRAA